jgi:hypothetical protein
MGRPSAVRQRSRLLREQAELRDGRCIRTRRLHSTLRTGFNLRTFPFDAQTLTLVLSDAQFPSGQVRYDDRTIAGLDDAALHELAAWKVAPAVQYARTTKAFRWDPGAPDYDYATFSVTVWRHVGYHIGRYFLPLLLIVIVSFGVFWINPEDLASEMSVAVTCLLAAVALQLAEGSALPEVAYLTIADRAFATSYVAIALSVLQALYTNHLSRAERRTSPSPSTADAASRFRSDWSWALLLPLCKRARTPSDLPSM